MAATALATHELVILLMGVMVIAIPISETRRTAVTAIVIPISEIPLMAVTVAVTHG
jgi:hypothetical protein